MTKKRAELPQLLAIRPWVLFRVTTAPVGQTNSRCGIHVQDLPKGNYYEFTGPAAFLWLLINGTRKSENILKLWKKVCPTHLTRSSTFAERFLEELKEMDLIYTLPVPKKDTRDSDMKMALQLLRKLNQEKTPRRKRTPLDQFGVSLEKGDSQDLAEVRKVFSKFLPPEAKVKITRTLPSAYQNQFHIFSADIEWKNYRGEQGLGAGLTVKNAAMAAMGEALERLFCYNNKPDVFSKSYLELKKLGKSVLDPESYQFFSPHQEAVMSGELINSDRHTRTHWSLFEDAVNPGTKILVPASINGYIFRDGVTSDLGAATSNGCAAGTDKDTVKLKGVLELLERDSFLFYWRTQNSPLRIDLSRPHPKIQKILDMLGERKNRLSLFYLRNDLKPITVQAVFRGNFSKGEPRFVSTAATRIDPVEAIEKAVLELLFLLEGILMGVSEQSNIFYGKNFDNSIWDLEDHAKFYSWTSTSKPYHFFFSKDVVTLHWSKIPFMPNVGDKEILRSLISDFKKQGLRIYFRDNTPSAISKRGFWTYRAFSPDLISFDGVHRYRQLGLPRYYNLARSMGLKRRPKTIADLNPYPHPLP